MASKHPASIACTAYLRRLKELINMAGVPTDDVPIEESLEETRSQPEV